MTPMNARTLRSLGLQVCLNSCLAGVFRSGSD